MSQNYTQDYSNMYFNNNTLPRYSEVDLFSTKGRLGQKHYFVYSTILPMILFWAVAALAGLASFLPVVDTFLFSAIMSIAILATACLLVILTIQRCHDINRSGWYAAFAIIPLANIVFALIPGTNGLNQYGEMPQPANTTFKIVFYAVVFAVIAASALLVIQLFDGNLLGNLFSL